MFKVCKEYLFLTTTTADERIYMRLKRRMRGKFELSFSF